jgi:ornithine cyclodeaminase/alanine dehydrogenase-like protein (mu-crystallin family)
VIDLADVLAGRVSWRAPAAGPIVFETQGVAIQDVAAAGLAWGAVASPAHRHDRPSPSRPT